MKRTMWLVTIFLLIMALPALAGCAPQVLWAQTSTTPMGQEPLATAVPAAAAAPTTGAVAALEGTLEQIYTQVNPSVVHIQVAQKDTVTTSAFPGFPGFGFQAPQGPQEFYRRGSGSGFVWDEAGHIVTNNHVVDGADRIQVVFYDGTTVDGQVVGADPDSDLAVVKVDSSAELSQPVQVADSTQVKVGQLAVAIGNPFALDGTMTVGFVSALGRQMPVEADGSSQAISSRYTIPDVIQTDAPINPGNSGGVLVNAEGQLIGVTSAIISSGGTSAGVGFAIPSAIVEKVVPVLIRDGRYAHPRLGISGTSLTPDLNQAMGLAQDQRGALVITVEAGGPADKAGVRGSDRQVEIEGQTAQVGGDVVVAMDGQPVKTFDDMVTYLARHTEVGQTVTLTLLRDNQQETVQVTLEARPTTGASS